uniref:Aldehyde dehydrogenase n=1 Tax=Xiphophorus couchianus TaxID=32473 RepID=A0A3B5LA38_9TELE
MSQEELVVERARRSFQTGRSKPLEFRLQQLRRLQSFLKERQEDIKDALQKDLGKVGNSFITHIYFVILWISLIYSFELTACPCKHINSFQHNTEQMQLVTPDFHHVCLFQVFHDEFVYHFLCYSGNAAIVKPSEISSTSSTVIKQLLPLYLDKDLYQVVEGGVPETQQLLKQRFDHIFYTGSTAVGKLVMEAAAPHLTPVTLELGGKSPCYIDKDCDIRIACRRITWAKLINCGQTCIAPDFILCEPSVQNRVVEEIRRCVKEFYADSPKTSDDYGRIINQRQFKRIVGLMEGCTIAFGGDADESQGPTVLKNVTGDSRVMQEEIFGPLLPIVTVQSVDEAIHFINEREKPLALYVFSHNVKLIEKVLAETSSGALVANDCIVHFLDSALPFGGVGHSGMGRYRGRHTFDQLSNLRSCMIKQLKMEGLNSMRYPPHSTKKLGWARRFLLSQLNVQKLRNMAMLAMLTCLAAFVVQRFLR